MKVRFLFHKPIGERGVGKMIVAWTWVLAFISLQWNRLKYHYSHTEVWLPDEAGNFGGVKPIGRRRKNAAHQTLFKGDCFSSTTRGKAKGVRLAPANVVLKNPERWDYIEVDMSRQDYDTLRAWIEIIKLDRSKYDFLGLFGFFFPVNIQDKEKWFCSELCAFLAFRSKILGELYQRISPRRLARVLLKAGVGMLKPLLFGRAA